MSNENGGRQTYETMTLVERLVLCTVKLTVVRSDGRISEGTGFFYGPKTSAGSKLLVIVTNKHVIDLAVCVKFSMSKTKHTELGPTSDPLYHFEIERSEFAVMNHPNPEVDLCAFTCLTHLVKAEDESFRPFVVSLDDSYIPDQEIEQELSAVEDVLVVGYPTGLWDEVNNQPITKRGSTATHPALDFQGKSGFLIDSAIFPGSSGSPVFWGWGTRYSTRSGSTFLSGPSRLRLLGVVSSVYEVSLSGVLSLADGPMVADWVTKTKFPTNLGYVIKARELRVFSQFLMSVDWNAH